MAAAGTAEEYVPRRPARLSELDGREGRIALTQWGPEHPSPILLLHGWMDCGAGWQLLVDQLPDDWPLVAVDWPGYGRSARRAERYWFADHLAELDWLAGELSPDHPLRLIGHSMGGTVASVYAGVRAARVAWLANLEGFGMPELPHAQFPGQLAAWLDALRSAPAPRRYPDLEALAEALRRANPRLPSAHARYLARAWTRAVDGGFEILADPRQQLPTPIRDVPANVQVFGARELTQQRQTNVGEDPVNRRRVVEVRHHGQPAPIREPAQEVEGSRHRQGGSGQADHVSLEKSSRE
jgi:pimeloyl-ACP methyl ester carboxylesterase